MRYLVVLHDQASEVRVNFVVMRQPESTEEGSELQSRGARRCAENQYFRRRSTFMKVNFNCVRV